MKAEFSWGYPCSNSPAHKVPDDVGMTDQYLSAILLLSGWCPVEVLAESSLNPWAITEEFLKGSKQRFQL